MVSIIRAAAGEPAIPAGFPILFDADMAIIEPPFVWLMEHAELSGRAQASETVLTYTSVRWTSSPEPFVPLRRAGWRPLRLIVRPTGMSNDHQSPNALVHTFHGAPR